MESLHFGLACLWCLCVLGQGQGTQLLPRGRGSLGSDGAFRIHAGCSGLYASEVRSWAPNPVRLVLRQVRFPLC